MRLSRTLIAEAVDLVIFVDEEPASRRGAKSAKCCSSLDIGMAATRSSMSENNNKENLP